MALEQPLPEFVRETGREEFINVMQETLRRTQLAFAPVPASAGAAGNTGDVAMDGSFAYFCVAKNTWLRVAIATW